MKIDGNDVWIVGDYGRHKDMSDEQQFFRPTGQAYFKRAGLCGTVLGRFTIEDREDEYFAPAEWHLTFCINNKIRHKVIMTHQCEVQRYYTRNADAHAAGGRFYPNGYLKVSADADMPENHKELISEFIRRTAESTKK